ncbi:MAG: hypothetical protein RMJ65_03655 [candidate division WOR-3 bacterium]|nr:hypothetical protein [candidate division WOR-3 bacterium]
MKYRLSSTIKFKSLRTRILIAFHTLLDNQFYKEKNIPLNILLATQKIALTEILTYSKIITPPTIENPINDEKKTVIRIREGEHSVVLIILSFFY